MLFRSIYEALNEHSISGTHICNEDNIPLSDHYPLPPSSSSILDSHGSQYSHDITPEETTHFTEDRITSKCQQIMDELMGDMQKDDLSHVSNGEGTKEADGQETGGVHIHLYYYTHVNFVEIQANRIQIEST